jgi:hypothetical protein
VDDLGGRVLFKTRLELLFEQCDLDDHRGDDRHRRADRRSHGGCHHSGTVELGSTQCVLDLAGSALDPTLPTTTTERTGDLCK